MILECWPSFFGLPPIFLIKATEWWQGLGGENSGNRERGKKSLISLNPTQARYLVQRHPLKIKKKSAASNYGIISTSLTRYLIN